MNTILITGITSFTGRYLSLSLNRRGYDVYGTSRSGTNDSKILKMEMTDIESIKRVINLVRPKYVVHLAGISNPAHRPTEDFFDINVKGSENLLSILESSNLDLNQVLLCSSACVYGENLKNPITENSITIPNNEYGKSKLCIEKTAESYRDKLPITIVRPFNYTGVGQSKKFLIPKIIDHFVRKQSSIELGNINISRDFSDVRDVCETLVDIIEYGKKSEVYNICSGKSHSIENILETMEKISGYRITVKVNKDLLRGQEVEDVFGSNKKLHSIIPRNQNYSFYETLSWMHNCWLM